MILYPYVAYFPEARAALEQFAPQAVLVDLSSDSMNEAIYGYCKLLRKHWDTSENLIIIEQSIVLKAEVLGEFERCPSLWCTYAYRLGTGCWTYYSLGCTKFAPELRAAYELPDAPWWSLDMCILNLFLPTLPCVHGTVEHLNDRGWLWDHQIYQGRTLTRNKDLSRLQYDNQEN